MSALSPLSLRIQQGVPDGARSLIWRSFFLEAGRGTTFEQHLPWYCDSDTRSVMVLDAGAVVATAIIRPAPQAGVAMVGYVCVDQSRRGHGLGRMLMEALNASVDDQHFQAALLWTSKPEVYVGRGYATIQRDRFVHVKRGTGAAPSRDSIHVEDWPALGTANGLPAFATSATRYSSDQATAVCAKGPRGVTLLDWNGEAVAVADLLHAAGHEEWSVNLMGADPFAYVLSIHRYRISEVPGAFTMARCQDMAFVPQDVPTIYRI
ncbi:GNAT family N-acetyltransferase [Sphingomonas pseudosanguinis]|uniref:GNAT superfamily N-acetyltransferase n=1 Tax=Sphingomonas pseudosanguinis TaxID=413712 RepID=A0A7W6AAB1_9SPHN|nr:GNAT superfamily N-acetyltransferase [Sphingomonas pseudosanguinis]MBN3538584.1 GNAT family N-acetyltransferase [Sphingomonas pseudosanguinis]